MYQQLSGIPPTGKLDDKTLDQTFIPRCGAPDIVHDENENLDADHDGIHYYKIQKYPGEDSLSLLSSNEIENVVAEAAQLWNSDGKLRITRSDSNHTAKVIISFESPSGWPGHTEEELARPVFDETTGKMLIHLDTMQSWADKNTLAGLTYGAAFNLHVQLLQVMLHQFGHVLGLPHTNRVTSVMSPYYYDWISEAELRPDAIDFDMANSVTENSTNSAQQFHSSIIYKFISFLFLSAYLVKK